MKDILDIILITRNLSWHPRYKEEIRETFVNNKLNLLQYPLQSSRLTITNRQIRYDKIQENQDNCRVWNNSQLPFQLLAFDVSNKWVYGLDYITIAIYPKCKQKEVQDFLSMMQDMDEIRLRTTGLPKANYTVLGCNKNVSLENVVIHLRISMLSLDSKSNHSNDSDDPCTTKREEWYARNGKLK